MSGLRYGDIVWADLDPSAGHEQTQRRPLIIVSNDAYNRHSNLLMTVPITSNQNYPLHVDVGSIPSDTPGENPVHGWAEIEQLKSLDLEARHAHKVATVSDATMTSILTMIFGCLIQPDMTLVKAW